MMMMMMRRRMRMMNSRQKKRTQNERNLYPILKRRFCFLFSSYSVVIIINRRLFVCLFIPILPTKPNPNHPVTPPPRPSFQYRTHIITIQSFVVFFVVSFVVTIGGCWVGVFVVLNLCFVSLPPRRLFF